MTYLATNRDRRPAGSRFAVSAVAILILLIAAVQFFAPHLFPAAFTTIAAPFWRAEFSLASGSLKSPSVLLSENESLKRQLSEDAVRLASVQAVESENAELTSLMGRASTTSYTLAAVLKRPPSAGFDILVIDLGSSSGLKPGNTVYAAGNVPIGRVSEALSETSKVKLFSSPQEKYEVLIGSLHAPATAIGRGGGQYEAELPRDMKIAEGEIVTVSSFNAGIFGIVSSVVSDPAQPFEKVLFAPPVNVYGIRWVLVDVKK